MQSLLPLALFAFVSSITPGPNNIRGPAIKQTSAKRTMAGKRYRVAASRLTSSSPVGNDPLSLGVVPPFALLPVPLVPVPIPPVSGKALELSMNPDEEEPLKPLEDEFDDPPVEGDVAVVVAVLPGVVVAVVAGGVGRATTAASISEIADWYIAVGRGA